MMGRKWGRITHISSISALENQGPPQYCAAKAALNAYIRSVGRFVAADGVVVTGVMPGAVMTAGGYWDEVMKQRPEHGGNFLRERMAIKRFGEVKEISSIVSFLVSDSASFMTGSVVLADGGQGRTFQ
jgi:3-oxoacyl-[acyl-carrier protein] reductase